MMKMRIDESRRAQDSLESPFKNFFYEDIQSEKFIVSFQVILANSIFMVPV